MNLFEDFANLVRSDLVAQGYDEAKVKDDDAVVRLYHKIGRYKIESRPRKVLKAVGFECPSRYTPAVQRLEQAIEAGESLSPYRSKNVMNPMRPDALLDYWGIHHLHLGSSLMTDGFIERTDQLLFCTFDAVYAYFIKIAAHNSAPWAKKELIEIIHRNWPVTIRAFRITGAIAVCPEISDEDRGDLRSANIATFLDMHDGTVYFEPGFGNTTGGVHIEDLRWADQMYRLAKAVEDQITRDWRRIADDARKQGYRLKGMETLFLLNTVPGLYWDIGDSRSGYWFRQYVQA